MTVPRAVEMIREWRRRCRTGFCWRGHVTDADTARQVIDAGASFVVSPIFRADIVAACHERDVPAMPAVSRRRRSSRRTSAAPTW
jgi:2-dehydro-3-deoxyphosphogluconate aldolase/(4S)-4-hydroxy-2-oxoglutarate aldolase